MNTLTRRDFLQKTAGFAGAVMLMPLGLPGQSKYPVPDNQTLGFQSWVVREPLVKDFAGTLKVMAEMGYESVEMCSPPGYAMAGFSSLQSLSASEMKRIMNGEGISCISCHYLFPELKAKGEERLEFALELGLTQMVVSTFLLPKDATLSDWKKAADEMNRLGEQTAENDVQLVFHNHHMEFEKLEGELIYDVLLQELDPALVKMQFQVAVANIGYRAADYFRTYPGRFISAHLSDWSNETEKQVPLGKGIVDWEDFFEASKEGGLQNYFVEMDMATLEESAAYLKSLG